MINTLGLLYSLRLQVWVTTAPLAPLNPPLDINFYKSQGLVHRKPSLKMCF